MKKISIMLILCLVLICGCNKSDKPSPSSPVTLTMWHNYGGDMQKSMDELIDEFNTTVGLKKGIVIDVTAISSSSELNTSLDMILNNDPGAPKMPDICTAYPKVAVKFQENGKLANLDNYFTKEELDKYIPDFLNEGRFNDGGLYVFPMAKSTEVLYLNKTLFDRFAKETGASYDKLSTFEGIAELSSMYYEWTDNKTPNIKNDGKYFFTADSWFNVAQVGLAQKGKSLFDTNNNLILDTTDYKNIENTFLNHAKNGGIAIYDGYSSDLSKTGDLVCSTGSSAGILFYGDTITHENNVVEQVEYNILPYPVWENGNKIAIQRGSGLIVSKTEAKKEYAAAEFLKWLTAPKQNMRFISSTGYLPVTKQAFTEDMPEHLNSVTDERIKKILKTVTEMYKEYNFITAPLFSEFDKISSDYEKNFKELLRNQLPVI